MSSVGGRPLMQTSMANQLGGAGTIKLTNQGAVQAGKIAIPNIAAGEAKKRLAIPAQNRQGISFFL
jgi:hypothetical protein